MPDLLQTSAWPRTTPLAPRPVWAAAVFLAACLLAGGLATASQDQDKPLLRTVIVDHYAPYSFINEAGEPDGFSVDLARAVCAAMARKLSIRTATWEQAMAELEAGSIDFLPMMAHTPERARRFDFSVPHTIGYDAIFTRKDGPQYLSFKDLSGKRVLVMQGDAAHGFIFASGLAQTMTLVMTDSLPSALRQLADGQADAAIMPKLVGLVTARQQNIAGLGDSPSIIEEYVRPFGFAVKKGDLGLLERLNQGLNIVKSEGRYDAIYDKWFGGIKPYHIDWALVAKIVLMAGAVLLSVLAWNVSLSRRVRVKTRDLKSEIERRTKAEEDIGKSYALLQKIIDTVPQAIFWKDDRSVYLGCNAAFARDAGISGPAEIAGKTDFDLAIEPEAAQKYQAGDRAVMDSGQPQFNAADQLIRPGGELAWLDATKLPLRDSHGRITGVLGVYTDVTENRNMLQALQRAKESAEAASKAKSVFLANMSHEIRTPLNGVMSMLQLLELTPLSGEQKEFLANALKSVRRLTRLLSDILDLSRIEAGKIDLRPEDFDIAGQRESVLELFAPAAREKGLALEFNVAPEVPAKLNGDKARLNQILFNLVGNAIKFTEHGVVRVEVLALPAPPDRTRLLFAVNDTGVGIPDAVLKEVYEPFAQAEQAFNRRFQGAGLGLAIVRNLVALMGGAICIDNAANGTTVYLSLPFKTGAA